MSASPIIGVPRPTITAVIWEIVAHTYLPIPIASRTVRRGCWAVSAACPINRIPGPARGAVIWEVVAHADLSIPIASRTIWRGIRIWVRIRIRIWIGISNGNWSGSSTVVVSEIPSPTINTQVRVLNAHAYLTVVVKNEWFALDSRDSVGISTGLSSNNPNPRANASTSQRVIHTLSTVEELARVTCRNCIVVRIGSVSASVVIPVEG